MKQLLVVIDIQQEYIAKGRPFHIKNITPSLTQAKAILEHARKKQMPILHVKHHRAEGDIFAKDNVLSEFIAGFEPQMHEGVFIKDKYSCFSSPTFANKLAEINPEEIFVIGYGSSMCCLCTIIDGVQRGYHFTLVEDATASRAFTHAEEHEMHHAAVTILKQYAKLITTQDWLTSLS